MPDHPTGESEDQKHRRLERGCLFTIIGLVIMILAIAAFVILTFRDFGQIDAALDELPPK